MLCKQLYETSDAALRSEAEKALVQFAAAPNCLNKCQMLLERGSVSTKCAAAHRTDDLQMSSVKCPSVIQVKIATVISNFVSISRFV